MHGMHNFCYEGPIVRANETPCNTCHPLWTNVRHFSTELWCIISPLYYNVITAPCPRANGNYEPLRKRYAALGLHNVSFGAHNLHCPSGRGVVISHSAPFPFGASYPRLSMSTHVKFRLWLWAGPQSRSSSSPESRKVHSQMIVVK